MQNAPFDPVTGKGSGLFYLEGFTLALSGTQFSSSIKGKAEANSTTSTCPCTSIRSTFIPVTSANLPAVCNHTALVCELVSACTAWCTTLLTRVVWGGVQASTRRLSLTPHNKSLIHKTVLTSFQHVTTWLYSPSYVSMIA